MSEKGLAIGVGWREVTTIWKEGRERRRNEGRWDSSVRKTVARMESSHPSRGWPTGRWRPRGVQKMTSLRVTETRVGRRSVDYYGMREVTVWVIVYSILDSPPLILFLLYIFRFPLSQEIPQAQQWPIPSSSSTSTTTRTTTSTGSQRPSPFPRTFPVKCQVSRAHIR